MHVLVEKSGDSYDKSAALISSHTGLVSFLGQQGHVIYGRGINQKFVYGRNNFIDRLYSDQITPSFYRELVEYGIDYIKIGPIEKRKYPKVSVGKFLSRPDLFSLVFKNKSVVIFMVKN
jgi:uncharacterized membrane protein